MRCSMSSGTGPPASTGMVGSGSGFGSLGVGATALPPEEPPEDEPPPEGSPEAEPPPEEFPEEAPDPPFAEPEPVAFEPEVFGLPEDAGASTRAEFEDPRSAPAPLSVGAAKPEPPSSDALRPPSSRRSAGSDSAPASIVEAVSSDVALVAPGPFAPLAPEGTPPVPERPCAPISGASGPSARARSAAAHCRTRGLCSARDGTAPAYTTTPTVIRAREKVRRPPSRGGADARRKARPA